MGRITGDYKRPSAVAERLAARGAVKPPENTIVEAPIEEDSLD
jgi:hypothetical protein